MKHCVITGASSGLGLETAKGLSSKGWAVTILCRNKKKAKKAIKYIKHDNESQINLILTELTRMQSVKNAYSELKKLNKPIDVLINNAGCLTQSRKISNEGWEYSNAINYLAPYLLTRLSIPLLAKDARIININSDGHRGQRLNIEQLNMYSGFKAYAHSKLTNALFIIELSKRQTTSLKALCADPGAIGSGFGGNLSLPVKILMQFIKPFLRTPKDASRLIIHLASCENELVTNGAYYNSFNSGSYGITTSDMEKSKKLWNTTEDLLKGYLK